VCGIAGFIDDQITAIDADRLIADMLEAISHRGPDARATWKEMPVVLGHNRLSIIDLSEDGNQPMHYFDSVIIFNGEIYNYIEIREQLKKEGYSFKTKSDTEVVLAAYRAYGRDCVKKFVGMWAFALWDKKSKELFCSRDRFGIKPFYYIQEGSRFYFGSEYKALKKSPVFSNDLNLDQVSRGLQLGWVCYQDETYYSKLKSLPAASNLIYKDGKITSEVYWELNPMKVNQISDLEEAKSTLMGLLTNSVSMHMRSDVEIAICLSGGIDSSSLTGLMANLYPSQSFRSYSIYFDGKNEVDERPFIQAVVDRYPQVKPHFYKPSPDEILERFHKIMYQVDVPSTGSSNFSHYYLLEQIHNQKIKVVVDGQGADEYLAGYMHSMYRHNADLIKRVKLFQYFSNVYKTYNYQHQHAKELLGGIGKTGLSVFLNEMKLYSFEYKNYYPFLSKEKSRHVPFELKDHYHGSLNNFLYHLLFTTSLPTILHYVDRMTMAHSIESRVPLLDHRLVEFSFSLKNELKINNGVTKRILRETAKNMLPEMIYNRRDKKGFVTPGEQNWLRGPMKHLLEINYNNISFLDKKTVKKVIDEYNKGDNKNSKLVWRLATLNYWLKNIN
jgi:asparagine synthase (glutamine-hydrolysing)